MPDSENVTTTRPPTIRECDTKHKALNSWVEKLERKIDVLDTRFLIILTLLIANLVGVIAIMLTKV